MQTAGESTNENEISVIFQAASNCIQIHGICDSGASALPTSMKPPRDVSCESYLYQWNDEFDMEIKN